MYLYHVLPAIEKGMYHSRAVADLPVGLKGYYQDHWGLMRNRNREIWESYKLPVLVALTIIREPVPFETLCRFSHVSEPKYVRTVIDEWFQFLYTTSVNPQGEREPAVESKTETYYRIYHASFQEFVAEKEQVKDEKVNLQAAHGIIADTLWDDFFGDSA